MIELDTHTLKVFKYFNHLNQSIVVEPGSRLQTITPVKNVIAYADVDIIFDKSFAIYDLSRWLSLVSLFDHPCLTLHDSFMNITDKDRSRMVRYTYADSNLILTPPKNVNMPAPDLEFELEDRALVELQKAASILQAPEIAVRCRDQKMFLETCDLKNKESDHFSIEIKKWSSNEDITAIFKCDNLRFIPGSYNVKISQKGIAEFTSTEAKYFVAIEA